MTILGFMKKKTIHTQYNYFILHIIRYISYFVDDNIRIRSLKTNPCYRIYELPLLSNVGIHVMENKRMATKLSFSLSKLSFSFGIVGIYKDQDLIFNIFTFSFIFEQMIMLGLIENKIRL